MTRLELVKAQLEGKINGKNVWGIGYDDEKEMSISELRDICDLLIKYGKGGLPMRAEAGCVSFSCPIVRDNYVEV